MLCNNAKRGRFSPVMLANILVAQVLHYTGRIQLAKNEGAVMRKPLTSWRAHVGSLSPLPPARNPRPALLVA
jgi:hypothetical protein